MRLPFPPRKTTIQMGNEAPMEIDADGGEQAERVLSWLKRKRQNESAEQELNRLKRRKLRVRLFLTALVLLAGGGIYSTGRLADYESVTVAAVTGSPTVSTDDGDKPLKPGMRLRLTPGLAFHTDSDSTAALRSRGVGLLLRSNTNLKVLSARYALGAIRRFQLTQGSVIAQVDTLHRDALFELTLGTTRAFCRPGLTFAKVVPKGPLTVAVKEGVVRVQQGEQKRLLVAGRQLTFPGEVVALSADTSAVLKRGGEVLQPTANQTLSDGWLGLLEDTVLPVWEPAREVVLHLPTLIMDLRAKVIANGALQAIAAALPLGDGPPQTLSPHLDNLDLPEATRKSLLKNLDRERIWLYKRLPAAGQYEFYAQARDSRKTVFLVRNGKLSTPKNEDIPLELS